MYEYCEAKKLPHRRCGKLIVAATEAEHHWVQTLYERGNLNGVKGLEILYSDRIRELEPNVRGYSALYSPNTGVAGPFPFPSLCSRIAIPMILIWATAGIVDYAAVARSFAKDLIDTGKGAIKLHFEVRRGPLGLG
jgi:2-hydroxyglutarate dehydrogenase